MKTYNIDWTVGLKLSDCRVQVIGFDVIWCDHNPSSYGFELTIGGLWTRLTLIVLDQSNKYG